MVTETLEIVNSSHAKGHSSWLGGAWVTALTERLASWRRRAREREDLAHMTSRDLADIGITRFEAEAEAAKPFWHA